MSNIAKLQAAEKLFLAGSLVITLSTMWGAVVEANNNSHAIFTVESLLWFFLASVVCTVMAASRWLVPQLAALFANGYFLHRIPLLYFFPELMDYPVYLGGSQEIIEAAAFYFFLCMFFLGLGISFVRTFHGYSTRNRYSVRPVPIAEPVRLFALKVHWSTIVRVSVPVGAALLATQTFALVYLGLGIVGAVRTSDNLNTLLAITEMTKFLLPVAVFGFLVGIEREDGLLKNRSQMLLAIVLVSLILVASRAAALSIAISIYIGVRFLGLKSQGRYARAALILVSLGVIAYPLITYSRYLLNGDDVTFFGWFENFSPFRELSLRLGSAVESYFVWFKYLYFEGSQARLPTLAVLIFDAVNGLVPGELINYEALVNYSKLQPHIGRPEHSPYQTERFLNELGGGGENPGTYGMAFMLFGSLSFFSFFFAGLLCSFLESSRISVFWKFYWVPFLLTSPWLIPSTAFLHQTILITGLITYSSYMQRRSSRGSAIAIRRGIDTQSVLRTGN
jgi:hypothetical protein